MATEERASGPRLRWWSGDWLRAIAGLGAVTPARREVVFREIAEGSQPSAVYYALLGISELIAGFALIVGSDATLIGANVVAPLMTPIFGISLRCVLTKDVTATGSTSLRPYPSLNGRVTEAPQAPAMQLLQDAEQVAREVAASRPGLTLTEIGLVSLPSGPVFVISIESPRQPTAEDVGRFETLLRERLGAPGLRVVVRKPLSTDVTSKGRIRLGEAHFAAESTDEAARRGAVERAVRAAIEAVPDRFAGAVDALRRDDGWSVRAEVAGPRVPTPTDVRGIEERSGAAVGAPVHLAVSARTELQVASERYEPLGDVPH